jgi:murein L,D-transpeptidase YcbB/YkuD
VRSLQNAIEDAMRNGLEPQDYIPEYGNSRCAPFALKPDIASCSDPELLKWELLLTHAFFRLASDLLHGRIDPETLSGETQPVGKQTDLNRHFEAALRLNSFSGVLNSLSTTHSAYVQLRGALRAYRQIAASGGWPTIPLGPIIRPGDTDPRVRVLAERVIIESAGSPLNAADSRYNDTLKRMVTAFQRNYGLEPDGVVGPATLAALNVPVESRIRQIELNLERWRWLPNYLGDRYLVVNSADFRLDVMQKDRRVTSMRAVVGTDYHQTPVFSAMLNRLVFNPFWYIPQRIAVEDVLPLLQQDPSYLQSKGITVFSGWGAAARQIDPETIDWLQVTPDNFKYVLRRDPGPANPLGRIKFMFPNLYDVYIHDTPDTGLFQEPTRTFSAGCIRIQRPVDLAVYVLKDDPAWGREQILAAIESGTPKVVRIRKPIPVHMTYWTAFADDRGSVQFRDDVYGRDRQLDAALQQSSQDRRQRLDKRRSGTHPPQ